MRADSENSLEQVKPMQLVRFLVLFSALAGGGYLLYRSEPVRQLFESSSPRREHPLDFLDEVDEVLPQRTAPEKPPAVTRVAPPAAEPDPGPPAVPNEVVTSTLLGILKARGLAYGIALSVSDRQLLVEGEVDSPEKRRQILDILEKGRGRRSLQADRLVVKP